jgi:hypothetical protein
VISGGVSEHALQEVGLDRNLLDDQEKHTHYILMFQFLQTCTPSKVAFDEWKTSEDENTRTLFAIMQEKDIFGKFLISKSISMWIRYGWSPPENLVMVLITSAIDEPCMFPSLSEEIKNIIHITDFELPFPYVCSLLKDSGFPTSSAEMDSFLLEHSEHSLPKQGVSKNTVLKMRSTLKLLHILLPRIELNDETAPELLFMLSKLGMDSYNGFYRDVLFRFISEIIVEISKSDTLLWPIVSHQWTEKLISYCKSRIQSPIFLSFLESCKNSIHNQLLMHWASSISFTILMKWGQDGWELESLLEPQAEKLLEWIQSHSLFTKATPSYLDTYTCLRFVRIILNHDLITSRKVRFAHLESIPSNWRCIPNVSRQD